MEENRFENGFYGAEPQKPFTDKTNPEMNMQADNAPAEVQEQTSAQSEQQPSAQQGSYEPEHVFEAQQTAPQQGECSYNTAPAQNREPVQGGFTAQQFGYYNPQNNFNPQNNPQNNYAPNSFQNNYSPNFQTNYCNQNYPPYPPMASVPVQQSKSKPGAGLIIIISMLCLLLVGSIAGMWFYIATNQSKSSSENKYSFSIPDKGYTLPQIQPATAPASEHKESDFSDKANPDYKGIELKGKPKDADSNKDYDAEYAFSAVSDSVVGVVGYKGEVTTVENSSTQGSGIIISSDGFVVTNAHVIDNSKTKYALQVVTPDGKTYKAGVVGYDSRTDIAVLKMEDAKDLKAATFGDSDKLELGEDIIVVGNPGGLDYQNSITKGVVSATDRKMSSTSLVKYIQTDAAINPGNSGGPIVNLYGQVVGIATSKIVSEKFEGMGFAIPSAFAKDIIDTLMRKGYVEGRVKIGITGSNVSASVASAYGIPQGILIDEITKGGPCDGTALKSGDIITGADGKTVKSFSEFFELLETKKPGDKLVIEYYRTEDDTTGKSEVTLTEDK